MKTKFIKFIGYTIHYFMYCTILYCFFLNRENRSEMPYWECMLAVGSIYLLVGLIMLSEKMINPNKDDL